LDFTLRGGGCILIALLLAQKWAQFYQAEAVCCCRAPIKWLYITSSSWKWKMFGGVGRQVGGERAS